MPGRLGACSQCRIHKTRCLLDENNPEICHRCRRIGHQCVFIPHEKRKPSRSGTNMRVAELEKNLTALQALLVKENGATNSQNEDNNVSAIARTSDDITMGTGESEEHETDFTTDQSPNVERHSLWAQGERINTRQTQHNENPVYQIEASKGVMDVVEEGLISLQTARRYLEEYRRELYFHFPIVYIPHTCTAEELRKTKPILFLALLAAVAGKRDPDLAISLDRKVLEVYATRCMVNSEKSLELVQSLLISALWFQPPSRLTQLKFNEYVRMAASMIMDMGIGTRSFQRNPGGSGTRNNGQPSHPLGDAQPFDPHRANINARFDTGFANTESLRSILAVYVSAANIGITLRRPPIFPMNRYMETCVEELATSPQATSYDRELAAWTRLLTISDEICSSFSHDDLNAIASIVDLRTQLLISALEDRLVKWNDESLGLNVSPALRITYFGIRIFLFEIVLYLDYPPEDFKAPFLMSDPNSAEVAQLPANPIVQAITQLIESSHALLDIFTSMDLENARALPVFCWIRVISAAFMLAKLSMSNASKRSRLRRFTNQASIKAEFYINKTLARMRELMGSNQYRVPTIFTVLLSYLRQRCIKAKAAMTSRANNESGHKTQDGLASHLYETATNHATTRAGPRVPVRSPSQLEGLLPGITETSRGHEMSGSEPGGGVNVDSPMTAVQTESLDSPWSLSVEDWQGIPFPGDGGSGYGDQNTWMSCPTQ